MASTHWKFPKQENKACLGKIPKQPEGTAIGHLRDSTFQSRRDFSWIFSNCDHVLNTLRILSKEGKLPKEEVEIYFFGLDDGGEPRLVPEMIQMGPQGALDQWPNGFFDTWDKCLSSLLDWNWK